MAITEAVKCPAWPLDWISTIAHNSIQPRREKTSCPVSTACFREGGAAAIPSSGNQSSQREPRSSSLMLCRVSAAAVGWVCFNPPRRLPASGLQPARPFVPRTSSQQSQPLTEAQRSETPHLCIMMPTKGCGTLGEGEVPMVANSRRGESQWLKGRIALGPLGKPLSKLRQPPGRLGRASGSPG